MYPSILPRSIKAQVELYESNFWKVDGFAACGPIDFTEKVKLSLLLSLYLLLLSPVPVSFFPVALAPVTDSPLRKPTEIWASRWFTAASVRFTIFVALLLSASTMQKKTPPRVWTPAGKWLPKRSIKERADSSSRTVRLAMFLAAKEIFNWSHSSWNVFLAMRMYCNTDALVADDFTDWSSWLLFSWPYPPCTSPTAKPWKPSTPIPMLVLEDSTVRTYSAAAPFAENFM